MGRFLLLLKPMMSTWDIYHLIRTQGPSIFWPDELKEWNAWLHCLHTAMFEDETLSLDRSLLSGLVPLAAVWSVADG